MLKNKIHEKDWSQDVREFLNEDYTQHLYQRAIVTDDIDTLERLLKKAKSIWSTMLSEVDQLINQKPIIDDDKLTVEYLLETHPEIHKNDAISLMHFSKSLTIHHKKCYGDGSIIFPKWEQIHRQ